jgi:hypothetical protein
MIKKLLIVVLLLTGLTPVHADTTPTIALIDSGVNTALFPNNVVYEVCAIENVPCPNGKPFMEGAGSAIPTNMNIAPTNLINHGNQMMSIITKINPNAKVIPIRIVGQTSLGNPMIYTQASINTALNWVLANREKFNISVVSISEGKIFAGCSTPAGMAKTIADLKAQNVVIVGATGNAGDRTAMDSPSCVPDIISVGATDNPNNKAGVAWNSTASPYIARYSNGNDKTTLYANGRWFVNNLDGSTRFMVGTSNATASVAGWLSLNLKGGWQDTYNALLSTASGSAKNEWLSGRYLLIQS